MVTALGWSQTAPAGQLFASDNIPPDRLKQYADLAVSGSGNICGSTPRILPATRLARRTSSRRSLDQEGIENQLFPYAPGRADLWARIPHTTSSPRRPIILLNHMDVVTSDASHWKAPPFSAAIVDGSIYGRGAQDMKNEGLAQFMVMVMLKREKVELDRDVIFLAVSDEEVNGSGS